MSRRLLRARATDQEYRGHHLFRPLMPLDPHECPDCSTDAPSAAPPSVLAPERTDFHPDVASGSHDDLVDGPIDAHHSSGSILDDGLPTGLAKNGLDAVLDEVVGVDLARNESGIVAGTFTLVDEDSLKQSPISWGTPGNVVVFVMHDAFEHITRGERASDVLELVEPGVAIDKSLIVIGVNPNADCSRLPCIRLGARSEPTRVRTHDHGETTLSVSLIHMVMRIFADGLAATGHSVVLKQANLSANEPSSQEQSAVKALLNLEDSLDVFHVKRAR